MDQNTHTNIKAITITIYQSLVTFNKVNVELNINLSIRVKSKLSCTTYIFIIVL